MYIKYLNKLYDLHIECDNYTEAAYTLMQHTILLDWSNDILSPLLVHSKYEKKTHRDLKEALYKDIIDNFDKGKVSDTPHYKYKTKIILFTDVGVRNIKMSRTSKAVRRRNF